MMMMALIGRIHAVMRASPEVGVAHGILGLMAGARVDGTAINADGKQGKMISQETTGSAAEERW